MKTLKIIFWLFMNIITMFTSILLFIFVGLVIIKGGIDIPIFDDWFNNLIILWFSMISLINVYLMLNKYLIWNKEK